jgi:hypothetical protein
MIAGENQTGTGERRCRKRKWIVNFQDTSRFDQEACFFGRPRHCQRITDDKLKKQKAVNGSTAFDDLSTA